MKLDERSKALLARVDAGATLTEEEYGYLLGTVYQGYEQMVSRSKERGGTNRGIFEFLERYA